LKNNDLQLNKEKIVTRVSWVGIWGNAVLTAFKLFAGIVAHSGAMVSDAVHSASDVFSTLIVLISVKFASKEGDAKHPYGHDRFECVAGIILAIILFATGMGIGYGGLMKIIAVNSETLEAPLPLALVAAAVSIVVKESMYWYTILAAKKLNSSLLKASAWDHRSDAFSSVGSFIGILGARLGYPKMDSIASLVICVFILKVAVEIFLDSVNKMMDRSCSDDFVRRVESSIRKTDGVVRIDNIKTRLFGDKVYVDIEIALDGSLELREAHKISHQVHDDIECDFPEVKHCMVHINPADSEYNPH
jgi:cation diffusion facilitator family transporter